MIKLIKYTGTQTFMFPSGRIATPEVISNEFPAVDVFPHVLQVSGNICQAVLEIASLRENYGIDDAISEDDAIKEIEVIMNQPDPETETVPSAEERIAAALEYQNLMNM